MASRQSMLLWLRLMVGFSVFVLLLQMMLSDDYTEYHPLIRQLRSRPPLLLREYQKPSVTYNSVPIRNNPFIIPLPNPPVWMYVNGHLRSYMKETGQKFYEYAQHMEQDIKYSVIFTFHTWSIFEHTQASWWKGEGKVPDDRTEVVKYLQSNLDPLGNYPFITFLVEDYDTVVPNISAPKFDLTNWKYSETVCAQYYSLFKVHDLATHDALQRGIELHPYDVIFKTRPDIKCDKLFNVEQVQELFKKKPYTVFSVYRDFFGDTMASDVTFIMSRAGMDRIRSVNFGSWFEERLLSGMWDESNHAPEYTAKVFFVAQGFEVKFMPEEFFCEIVRKDDRPGIHMGRKTPIDYEVIDIVQDDEI